MCCWLKLLLTFVKYQQVLFCQLLSALTGKCTYFLKDFKRKKNFLRNRSWWRCFMHDWATFVLFCWDIWQIWWRDFSFAFNSREFKASSLSFLKTCHCTDNEQPYREKYIQNWKSLAEHEPECNFALSLKGPQNVLNIKNYPEGIFFSLKVCRFQQTCLSLTSQFPFLHVFFILLSCCFPSVPMAAIDVQLRRQLLTHLSRIRVLRGGSRSIPSPSISHQRAVVVLRPV